MKLMEGEDVLMEMRPEAKLLVIWFFRACFVPFLVIGILLIFISPAFGGILETFSDTKSKLLTFWLPAAIGFVLCITIISCVYCIYLRRTYIYTITNRRCIFSGGILRHVRHSVPYHKITDVEMSQNIIERMLGISSLGIYTPGTGSMGSGSGGRRPEIAYVGLKDNETPAETINGILSTFKATGE